MKCNTSTTKRNSRTLSRSAITGSGKSSAAKSAAKITAKLSANSARSTKPSPDSVRKLQRQLLSALRKQTWLLQEHGTTLRENIRLHAENAALKREVAAAEGALKESVRHNAAEYFRLLEAPVARFVN